jgi:CelD/BcsL family acetyltransferase involved in cellulose biosynthesis
MSRLQVSILTNFEDWLAMASEWNLLLHESRSGSFFLTWEWLFSWAECFLDNTRSLFILLFHKDKELVGIAPLYIERRKIGPFSLRVIFFLGTPEAGSDYLDVIVRQGMEKDVANTFYDFLTMGDGIKTCWDLVVLSELPAGNLFLVYLMERIQAQGRHMEFVASSYCPVMKLPASEADLYALLSAGWRKKVKQDIRVINREENVIHEVIRGAAVAAKLPEFFCLYEEKAGWSSSMVQPVLQQLITKYGSEAPVQVDLLYINGQLVAGILHLEYRNTRSLYLMAVDKKYNPKVSLGNFLVGKCINNAIDSGYLIYDFLKGMEGYKFHWATEGNRTVQLTFWQKRPLALAVASAKLARQALKLFIR